ncbi:MAG: hypothetical protein ABEI74_03805 [Candidatus Pacearchaeota archaeon]
MSLNGNEFYLEVKGEDFSHRVLKYNFKRQDFNEVLDLETTYFPKNDMALISEDRFIHTADLMTLATNDKTIEGTEIPEEGNKEYLSLAIISQKGNDLYVIAGGRNIPVYEYRIDLQGKPEVKESREVYSPNEGVGVLQPIRYNKNHDWLMNESLKNE